jgi:hypothetical protein
MAAVGSSTARRSEAEPSCHDRSRRRRRGRFGAGRAILDEIPPPTNREALLEQLRARARSLSPDQVARLTARVDRV